MATLTRRRSATSIDAWLAKTEFRLSASKRAKFYEQMASLLRDGKPLDASLREMLSRYQKKKRAKVPLLRAWVSSMDEGKTFADACNDYVADTESIILAAGEKSGTLADALEQAALVARASSEITKAVRSEMTAPVVQLVVLVAVLIFVSTSVAPGLARSIPAWAFDSSQQAFFGLAAVVAKAWAFAVPALVAAVVCVLWSLSRYTGPLRMYLDRIPPWSVYRVYSGSTFMISLAALIRSGVPIEASIRFIRGQAKPWMREHLSEMVSRLRSGANQGDALDVGLLSDEMSDTVYVYSRTADFDSAMNSLGKEAIKSGIEDIKAKAGIARVVTTVAFGLLVGWMFDAMMGISDAAQRANTQHAPVAAAPHR